MRLNTVLGYVGVVLITLNTLPGILQAVHGGATPAMGSILLMLAGLALLLVQSVEARAWLYVWANGLGLIGNLVLLTVVLRG